MARIKIKLDLSDLSALPQFVDGMVSRAIIDAQAEITKLLQAGLVETTPVLTGQARNNWEVGVGSKPNNVIIGGTEIGVTGSPATSTEMQKARDAIKVLRSQPVGQTVYFTNRLNYVAGLDVGDSTKAPQGIRAVAIDRALSRSLKDVQSSAGDGDE